LLRLAAVAGVRVGHGLLAAAGDLSDDVLLAAARELAENYLLVADPSGVGYVFRHALTREAVYDDLLPGERQRLHRAMARALTDEPALGPTGGWAVAEAVAEHWFAAGDLAPALAASVAAGKAGSEVFAVGEALAFYERALELWDQVAEPETVAGVERPVLFERVAKVASDAGEHDRAFRYVDAAIGNLEQAAVRPTRLGLLYAQKGWYGLRSGREGEWQAWTGRAVALVASEPPTPETAGILADHALALTSMERYEDAREVASNALDAALRARDRKCEARARSALGLSLVMTSSTPELALRELRHARSVARELGDAEAISAAYSNLCDALIALGQFDEAAAHALEAAKAGTKLGALPSWLAWNILNAAEAQFLAGRWDDCQNALDQLPDPRVGGYTEQWGLALTALLQASRGHDDAAATAIAAARSMSAHDVQNEGMLSAAQAQLALNAGDLETAHRAVFAGLDVLTDSESQQDPVSAVALAALGLQVEADRAQIASGRRRHDPETGVRRVRWNRLNADTGLADSRLRPCPPIRGSTCPQGTM
jgi:tetratricopeptide (TPR) repeat protein